MKDGVSILRLDVAQQAQCFVGRCSDDIDPAPLGFRPDVGHDRQAAGPTGADDQPLATPRDPLLGRQRSVPESVTVGFGWLLDPFGHPAFVDHDVVAVALALDLALAELEP